MLAFFQFFCRFVEDERGALAPLLTPTGYKFIFKWVVSCS
jgi:hypothetical protein